MKTKEYIFNIKGHSIDVLLLPYSEADRIYEVSFETDESDQLVNEGISFAFL